MTAPYPAANPFAADEAALIAEADALAQRWLTGIGTRPVFPPAAAIEAVAALDAPLAETGIPARETLRVLDEIAGAATVASNDPRYFGFVVGSSLPVAAAADRLALAWDQCASSFDNSPAVHLIERHARRLVLDALDLPREAGIGFSTSATAGTIAAVSTARRVLLARQGWDFDRQGLAGAPAVRVVISELAHVTVLKGLRLLGFGLDHVVRAPVDDHGRIRPETLPALDASTILILQAGEVNTGEFDPFAELIPAAHAAGAWVHVDGAFGLWARASRTHRHLTEGIEQADSWTTDAHKWLNVPYDSAMHIVREATHLSEAMNADAVYFMAAADAQRNLTLEFSRKARGVSVWAALRTLGREGVEAMVDRHIALAQHAAQGLREAGYTVVNRVVLNQVLIRADSPAETVRVREAVTGGGAAWFSATTWQGQPALRLSVSSWRTEREHVDVLVSLLREARTA